MPQYRVTVVLEREHAADITVRAASQDAADRIALALFKTHPTAVPAFSSLWWRLLSVPAPGSVL
jgi:hypothetical protein